MKLTLKNLSKYNRLKMLNLHQLDDILMEERHAGDIGVSTKSFGKYWFYMPKGKAIFKTYDAPAFKSIKEQRMYNELICYELCKRLGIACAVYEPAVKQGIKGLVTYNVAEEDEVLITGDEFLNRPFSLHSIEDYMNRIYEIDEYQLYKIDIDETYKTLFKILVFDLLTLQTDRHNENLFFLKNETKKTIRLAPLIDNEFAFGGKKIASHKYTFTKNSQEFLESLATGSSFMLVKRGYFNLYEDTVKDAVALAERNPELKKILLEMLEKIDVNLAIFSLKAKGCILDAEYETFIENVVKSTKRLFYKELKNNKILQQKIEKTIKDKQI